MQVVTIATKFERAQIHFTSDVFAADIAKTFEPCHRYGIATKANIYLYFSKLHDEFEQRWVEPFNLEEWSSSHES